MRLDTSTTWVLCWVLTDIFQLVALDQVTTEVLSLIRSVRNRRAPINRLPCDVLALIPDFWGRHEREKVAITLTYEPVSVLGPRLSRRDKDLSERGIKATLCV